MEVIPLNIVLLVEVNTIAMPMTTIVEIPSVAPLTTLEKTVELAKSMEEMNL